MHKNPGEGREEEEPPCTKSVGEGVMERDRSLRERVRQGSHASLDLSKEDAVRRAARARHVRARGVRSPA